MKLTQDNLLELCNIAIEAALESGEMIHKKSHQHIEVKHKATGTSLAAQVVTEVDILSQEIILKHISPTCKKYELGLLAEESDDDLSRFAKDYFWCIDPLDGTLPFTESRAGYAISIALVSKTGQPFIGVVFDPLTQTLYHAIKGGGAFRNNENLIWNKETCPPSKNIESGGAVMNVCWILDNKSSYYCHQPKQTDGGGCLWDYAATACLFEELDLPVSDIYGKPLELNRKNSTFMNHKGILFARNKQIAETLRLNETQ